MGAVRNPIWFVSRRGSAPRGDRLFRQAGICSGRQFLCPDAPGAHGSAGFSEGAGNLRLPATNSFWRDKRVLVTGHTGFKGAWACVLLERLGALTSGLALASEEPSLYTQANVSSLLVREYIVDLREDAAIFEAVHDAAPQIVLHFAAQSLVRRAYRDPAGTFSSNVQGTANLLEALRSCRSVECIVVTTTDKVYFNDESGRPFREGDRLGGHEPYSASKSAAEMIVAAYRGSYFDALGVPVLVARAGNVIGGGDWSEDRIVPDIIRSVMSGAVLDVRNPQAVRPWQHVIDALVGYLLLVEKRGQTVVRHPDPEAMAWNFGPAVADEMITVGQICDRVSKLWPGRLKWEIKLDHSGPKESGLLLLDPQKAMSDLDWRPRFDADAALRHTLDWYRAALEGAHPLDLTRAQIDSHLTENMAA